MLAQVVLLLFRERSFSSCSLVNLEVSAGFASELVSDGFASFFVSGLSLPSFVVAAVLLSAFLVVVVFYLLVS